MEYKIRLIRSEDNEAISHIIKSTLEELDCALEGTVYTDRETDHMYENYQKDGTVYYVAESNGMILGGAGIAPIANQSENYCELQKMYLIKEMRGFGIGKALMEKCLEFAREQGYELIYLETFGTMTDAQIFYKHAGFDYIDHPMGDTGHFSCDVYMAMSLK
ncbi:MAG: GNAT family N-acetyltransferase [Crocinitomicaceae bacterium]|nr:GNAT family N-acetyltransferase [Crocinitomicaceae bacterium]